MQRTYAMCALAALLGLSACADRDPMSPTFLGPQADSVRVCGSEGEAPCSLGPITGTVDPIRPTDEEEDDDGGGDGGGGDVGGGGGGGGSGGGSTPSDDTPPGDTIPSDTACKNTGDALVDNLQVQDAFETVWAGSNADAGNQDERRERGGWIVKTATGYAFEAFSNVAYGPCEIKPLSGVPEPPTNVVAWVHSHPFRFEEFQLSCAFFDEVTGLRVVPQYLGDPSRGDAVIGDAINQRLRARGAQPIDGFILDKNGILRWRPLGDEMFLSLKDYGRCAY